MRGDIFCHYSSFQLFELNDRGANILPFTSFSCIFFYLALFLSVDVGRYGYMCSVFLGPFFHECTCESSSSIVNLYETVAYAVFSSCRLFNIVIGLHLAFMR